MPVLYHVCRRARPEDIPRSQALWAQDRVLYEPDVWNLMPSLLQDLMGAELVSFAIVESLPDGEPRLLGGVSFVQPEWVAQARTGSGTLANAAMRAVLRGERPFLSPKQVAAANARSELQLLTLFGNIDVIDLSNPALADFYRTSNEGHRFFHFGYSFRAMWFEVWEPHHVYELQQLGMQIDRRLVLTEGKIATLLRLTREDALANPYTRFSGYFFPPTPSFAFSSGEQQLLEYALLEASDEETAEELHLSKDAIKKRWRSIYSKVEAIDRRLLSGVVSGAARRRTVLHYLRQHLEELRPYGQSTRSAHRADRVGYRSTGWA